MKTQSFLSSDFKGFGDYVEVFRAGTHVDHAGNSATWTTQQIDQMVTNHTPDSVPIVVGHPATDASSASFGWADKIKREGKSLFVKFKQVHPQFAQMVEDGRFKNRSIRILKTTNGLKLGHVGWLGATPPAIEGLQPIEFASEGDYFDFSSDFAGHSEYRLANIVTRLFRRMRESIIAKDGIDAADTVLSGYDVDELGQIAEQLYQDASNPTESIQSSFSKQVEQMPDETKTQADIDAANQKAADFAAQNQTLQEQLNQERSLRKRTEHQAEIDKHLKRGVKPAYLVGAVDFMLSIDEGDAAVFEFAQGEGDKTQTVKINRVEFVKGLLAKLPAVVQMGKFDFGADVEPVDSAEAIAKAATAYQFAEGQAGRTVSAADAVIYVTTKGQ